MSKHGKFKPSRPPFVGPPGKQVVGSLLDSMRDGAEFGSLVGVVPRELDARAEIRRAITEVEEIRKRPLLVYAANVIKPLVDVPLSISVSDDLPFAEMVAAVPTENAAVDILVVTPGGLGQQVSQFVGRLRPRFADVGFILPHMAMSAGTIWALSGNEIWMDARAFIGPIDPQVQGRDGKLLPAQALLVLVDDIKNRGEQLMKQGQNPTWTDIQIIRNIDPKELGNAITLSRYSIQLASSFLENYKFRDWKFHKDGTPVTPEQKRDRAQEVASKLCSHELWKTHSHGISRDVAWQELKIKINEPEGVPGLQRSIRRLWALIYWLFENTRLAKVFVSNQYALFRSQPGVAK